MQFLQRLREQMARLFTERHRATQEQHTPNGIIRQAADPDTALWQQHRLAASQSAAERTLAQRAFDQLAPRDQGRRLDQLMREVQQRLVQYEAQREQARRQAEQEGRARGY